MVREDGSEFEIYQTKPAIGKSIGDVAGIGVIMANAEFFELGEKLFCTGVVNTFHTCSTVGSNDPKIFFIDLQKTRHEIAAMRG